MMDKTQSKMHDLDLNEVNDADEETTVIANSFVAPGTYSLPQAARIKFWRLTKEKKSRLKTFQVEDSNGVLHLRPNVPNVSWISLIKPAADCQEQNCEAFWSSQEVDDRVQIRVVKPIQEGQELKVWFSSSLPVKITMPFLEPKHIQGPSRYVCHKCGQSFQQPNPLKVHLYYEGCDAVLPPTLTSLESNNRAERESRVKGHVCNYCNKAYSRRYGLKIHIRTHTGYKPLKCPYCFRPFSDPSNLNKHVRLHVRTSNPYNCLLCGKVLVRRRDLDRHLKSRHPSHINHA